MVGVRVRLRRKASARGRVYYTYVYVYHLDEAKQQEADEVRRLECLGVDVRRLVRERVWLG